MGLLTLTNKFGAMNNRAEPHIVGPNTAQALSNVVLDSMGIVPQKDVGSTITSGSGTARSLYKFNSQYIISTEARQYIEYAGHLIYAVAGQVPKRSADGTTFYNLGLKPTLQAPSAAAGAAGNPNGTYSYYVTFTGTLGGESGLSAAIEAGLVWVAFVSSAGNIKLRIHNTTGGGVTPASATWKFTVLH